MLAGKRAGQIARTRPFTICTSRTIGNDCEGIRKTMKYELPAPPLILQIGGARDNSLSIAILPAE